MNSKTGKLIGCGATGNRTSAEQAEVNRKKLGLPSTSNTTSPDLSNISKEDLSNNWDAIKRHLKEVDPIAEELMVEAKKDVTTKDGYGVVMNFLMKLNDPLMGKLILLSMQIKGYPHETLKSLMRIVYNVG